MPTLHEYREAEMRAAERRHHAEIELQAAIKEEKAASDSLAQAVAATLGVKDGGLVEFDYGRGKAKGRIVGILPPYDPCRGEFRVQVALVRRDGLESGKPITIDQTYFRPEDGNPARASVIPPEE